MREQDKLVQEVLISFLESLNDDHPDASVDVQRVLRCIHEHLFDPKLTVQWLSENCRIRNHNFSGKFRHYTGMGVKEYILELRMEAAREVILGTLEVSITMSEVGYQIGFMSYATFNRAFSRKFGVTPARWRKEK